MKNRKDGGRESGIGRREFVKIATGAVAGAATIGALSGVDAAGQAITKGSASGGSGVRASGGDFGARSAVVGGAAGEGRSG